jgi:hypothetical protein
MSDPSKVWPPPATAGTGSGTTDGARTTCPKCSRKLLTQGSPFCNWCGERIEDEEFQARAAEARQSQDSKERSELEALIQEEAQFGVIGRLKRRAKSGGNPPRPLI